MSAKKMRRLALPLPSDAKSASDGHPASERFNVRFFPSQLARLKEFVGGDRSEFIRAAIEQKILKNPTYEKRPQVNGGEYINLRVPEILLLALQCIPERDRAEFIRQAVDERLNLL